MSGEQSDASSSADTPGLGDSTTSTTRCLLDLVSVAVYPISYPAFHDAEDSGFGSAILRCHIRERESSRNDAQRWVKMSEQGWREFLEAEGVDDWVVLHGGAAAVFRVSSILDAAWLATAGADVPGLAGSGALLTVADDHLSVRLSRDMWQLEARHAGLARAVSDVARTHGAVADCAAVQEVQVAIAAKSDEVDL